MLSLAVVHKVYYKLKKDIGRHFIKRDIWNTLRLIDTYANIAHSINDIMRDDELEHYLSDVAKQYVMTKQCTDADNKKVVFYDQIGTTVCLGLQYIRGLKANGYEILYIYENFSGVGPTSSLLLEELKKSGINVIEYPNKEFQENTIIFIAQKIQKDIIDFHPSKLFIHSPSCGALGSAVLYSLQGITRYRIVPGDHHFYIGYDCIDYFIEFRDYGISQAIYNRHIEINKIIKLPYYPIIDTTEQFKGFPPITKEKIVFATAGAEYKFLGSEWLKNYAKWLLSSYPDSVLVFIGDAPKTIKSFIKTENLEDRFIVLGYRKDFAACISNIDILINSYPIGGGLICQTAAYFKKPIISYISSADDPQCSIRSILGNASLCGPISYSDNKELQRYTERLIADDKYRVSEGERIYNALQTQSNFNITLGGILNGQGKSTIQNFQLTPPLSRTSFYLNLQSSGVRSQSILGMLYGYYGFSLLYKMPYLINLLIQNKTLISTSFTNKMKHAFQKQ